MPGPADLFAQIQARTGDDDGAPSATRPPSAMLMAALQKKQGASAAAIGGSAKNPTKKPISKPTCPDGKLFDYDDSLDSFLFQHPAARPSSTSNSSTTDTMDPAHPILVPDSQGHADTDILVPLGPCIYRLTDYTMAKKEPILRERCLLKLGVLRCLQRECETLNHLLWHRLNPNSLLDNGLGSLSLNGDNKKDPKEATNEGGGAIEEEELGKARFMELLSNCGVYQKVSEMIIQKAGQATDRITHNQPVTGNSSKNPFGVPQIRVNGLDEFMKELERLSPALSTARQEIEESESVSFYPGLGELFTPGSKLLYHPEGMEGIPMGCSCVQSWYTEELNKATNKVKRRFILVIEFIVSVGDELVFVAASEVYPEFHDPSRNAPIKDLKHRKFNESEGSSDRQFLERLQQRGEFYASVATKNHYLEYQPNSFFPIIGGWGNNATRPLSKGGRVMVDVKRGILENHIPVRGSADGMSDTVKEAIKLFEQNKRTGIAVPFRTCILPGFDHLSTSTSSKKGNSVFGLGEPGDSDRQSLWQTWPMIVGFSFTARVWGKLLLSLPKPDASTGNGLQRNLLESPRRRSVVKRGVSIGGLGGAGRSGSCNYINFQEKAFDQLVLAEEKKELIRAVARNSGSHPDDDGNDEDDDEDEDDMGLDVVANKGAASIFLLYGPPGCGKTLTAEAIAELLKKPLYVVTAGDLGITAAEVEKSLGSVLELCQTWDALVLLDEADIFLEARNSTEIQRNALVCVMLRLLEYYSGCLFLSSNRAAATIDAAIASRITVMLGYPPLDEAGRSKVWKNLVELVSVLPTDPDTGEIKEKLKKFPRKQARYRDPFSEDDYVGLGKSYKLNGRQIKNSIVLARALARERGVALSIPVLQKAVTAVAGEGASTTD